MTSDPYVVRATKYRQLVQSLAVECMACRVAEVGVCRGELSKYLITIPDLERLVLVDDWSYHGSDAQGVQAWASQHQNIDVVSKPSVEGALSFPDSYFDFVHIDASHIEADVAADIDAWLQKTTSGGVLSGDNYEFEGVRRAVSKAFDKVHVWGHGRIWWLVV